jgi:hypothetical protein
MDLSRFLLQILNALFTCSHGRARVVEGKTFCPDCGQGVIFKWVVLRCKGCNHRRPTRYLFRQVVPLEPCCTYCGEQEIRHEYLSEPEYFQLRYALLSFQAESQEDTLWDHCTFSISAWIKDSLKAVETTCNELPRLPVHQPSSLSF